jgi:uncharacterized protein GlcG (DUF336 family)
MVTLAGVVATSVIVSSPTVATLAPITRHKTFFEADKSIFPRAGALPIMVGNDVIGAIGFGGANGTQGGGTHDEACAKAGLDKIKARVK